MIIKCKSCGGYSPYEIRNNGINSHLTFHSEFCQAEEYRKELIRKRIESEKRSK